jgi:hypothetical protein
MQLCNYPQRRENRGGYEPPPVRGTRSGQAKVNVAFRENTRALPMPQIPHEVDFS